VIQGIEEWLGGKVGGTTVGVVAAFAVSAAANGEISWLLAVLIELGAFVLPPLFLSGWLKRQSKRWSREAAFSAVASAALVAGITALSVVAGVLAVWLVFIAYLGGRFSS
jgi:sulfite exporter TauE/SafE